MKLFSNIVKPHLVIPGNNNGALPDCVFVFILYWSKTMKAILICTKHWELLVRTNLLNVYSITKCNNKQKMFNQYTQIIF